MSRPKKIKKYMTPSSVFKFLTGDMNYVDYGGKWYRCVAKGRFHVIELTNMDEACGRDNEGRPTYVVELSGIDLYETPRKEIESALRSCGWKMIAFSPKSLLPCTVVDDYRGDVIGSNAAAELVLVEALHSYGCRAPLESWEGNNWEELMKLARAESKTLDDPIEFEERMNRPVNQLGSSAREYMQGDIQSALVRGVAAQRPEAMLMAKLQGAPDDVIEAVAQLGNKVTGQGPVMFQVKLNSSEAKDETDGDPLPYVVGYGDGLAGRPAERDDVAESYTKGYERGVLVRKGEAQPPSWIK